MSLGYEQRSSAFARHLVNKPAVALAVEFNAHRNAIFLDNQSFYRDAGWDLSEDWGKSFESAAGQFFDGQRGKHVVVDVSSMTRWRIASVVAALAELEPDADLTVDFVYLPAEFVDPPEPPAAVLKLRPASTFFAGNLDADGPTTCLIGLGYEPEKAAGTIDTLEPSSVIGLVPRDLSEQYLSAVNASNEGLLRGPLLTERIEYHVNDPYGTYVQVDQLVTELIDDGVRPALVPMGPKMFAAICLLVGARHEEDVSVWRASFRGAEPPGDHVASGEVYGLRITIGDGPG